MLIDCPACARSYHVSQADIGTGGRTVICPRCRASWHVGGTGDDLRPNDADIPAHAFSARPAPERAPSPAASRGLLRRLRPVFVGGGCLALATGVIAERVRVTRLVPRAAALYAAAGMPVNVRGLVFSAVRPTRANGSPDLTIAGEIRSVAANRVRLPRLFYEVRDSAGATLVSWSESAPARTIAVGHVLAFASTPHAVPPEGRTILVRFEPEDGVRAAPIRLVRADTR